MRSPQGLLDQATAVTVTVFDASLAACDDATGHVDKIPEGSDVITASLSKEGCPAGLAWCKTLEIERDGNDKMFAIAVKNGGAIIGEGCTTAIIDKAAVEVEVTVRRFVEPPCCGDGRVQPGEQCDPAPICTENCTCSTVQQDATCLPDCTAEEIHLSAGNPPGVKPKVESGPPGSKSHLSLTFGPGGVKTPNMMRAAFVNSNTADALGNEDVMLRYLANDLSPITDPAPLSLQLGLPLRCSSTTIAGVARKQHEPVLAVASTDTVALAYVSNEDNPTSFSVFLAPFTANGCVDTKPCTDAAECMTGSCDNGFCADAIKVSALPGTSQPHLAAGPAGTVLVVWSQAQSVLGRIWKTDGTLFPPLYDLTITTKGSNARVAGDINGWKVVYAGGASDDADAILLSTVSIDGVVGAGKRVNAVTAGLQEQPDIALEASGRSMVVWRSDGDIYFQRFDETGEPLAGDQNEPLNTSGRTGSPAPTNEQRPVVAASLGFGEFYAVAWETTDTHDIIGRFVDAAKGFGFNSVNGQNTDFIATSRAYPGVRQSPAITVGGAGFVVIGWEDVSDAHPGVYARRFPLPTF